jgi:TPR repeat protein
MYACGQGAPRDLVQAWCWLQRAAAGNAPGAARYAERVRARMEPDQQEQAQRLLASA